MKRFRLDITGKLEDRPRLLRAYGKIPGGEVALVLRPTAYGGVLVHVTKDGATQWSAGAENIPADWPRVRVAVERGETTVLDGPLAGRALNAPVLARGSGSVALGPDGQVEDIDGDAPRVPADVIDARTAVAAVKHAQKDVPKPGASTLRGQWSGTLTWDHGPYVELRRKLATYGTLVVNSGADGWRWRFEREERWFTSAGHEADGPFATLVQAIDAGMLGALGLVQPACGVRDTRRRSAYDATWAKKHPLPEPKSSTDPTERLRDPSSAETSASERKIRRSSTATVVDAASVPSVPRTPRAPKVRSTATPAGTSARTDDADADSACGCAVGNDATSADASRGAADRRSTGAGANATSSSRSSTGASTRDRSARASNGGGSSQRSNGGGASSKGSNGPSDAGEPSRGTSSRASNGGGTSSNPSTRGNRTARSSGPDATPGRSTRGAAGSGTRPPTAVATPPAEASTPAGSTDEASLIQAFSAAVAAALID